MSVTAEEIDQAGVYAPYLALWRQGDCLLPERALLAWAQSQRLLPLLLWRGKKAGWALPDALTRAAQNVRYREQAQQMLAEDQLRALGALAQKLDIPLVLVKGACVARAYPETWLRPYNDIDLLIAEEHLPYFLPAVLDLGYTWLGALTGQRGWHLPPLAPKTTGLKLEVHTALARERGRSLFTFGQWTTGIHPFIPFPGLWVPDPVDHALYMIHHAIVHHELVMGFLPFIDLAYWTQSWGEVEWQALAEQARTFDLYRVASLSLSLTAWLSDIVWPRTVQQLFPVPPDDILLAARRIVIGAGTAKLPHLQRDMPERNLRGLLKYLGLILLGDPVTRQALPRSEKIRFYLRRPFQLLSNHGPTLWRLVRGERRTRAAWQVQRRLQAWLRDEHL